MAHFNYAFDSKQVKSQWEYLKRKYMEEYDACHKTGSAPSTWEWYRDIDDMFGKSASVEAPFSYSAGTTSEYCVGGKTSAAVDRGGSRTRTAPPTDTKKTTGSKAGTKKASYKDRVTELKEKEVELQEKKVHNQGTFLDELRLMREAFAATSSEQTELLRLLVSKRIDK